MPNLQRLSIFNALALLLHIATTFAVQSKWINELSVGEVSDLYSTLFTPAGFTFSIWGLIYFALIVFCVFHIYAAFRLPETDTANKKFRRTNPWFIINNLATSAWLLAWTHEKLLLSVVLIIIQLISLVILHNRLCIHDATTPMRIKLCIQFPISIYFGWITVATAANIPAYLMAIGWNGWDISAINWSITLVAVVTIITIWVMNKKLNVIFGLVVSWGFYGIASRLSAISKENYEPVIYTIYGALLLIGFNLIIALIRNLRKPDPRTQLAER
jgi:hypothetical protein